MIYQNMRQASVSEDERCIVDLIEQAAANGIVSNPTALDDEGYFELTVGDVAYELCFGRNPNRATHPRAERASRASELVSRLFNLIDSQYNCYIVPFQVALPGERAVGERLFGEGSGLSVQRVAEQSTGRSRALRPSTSLFEVEVSIVISLGQECRRIHDTVVAKWSGRAAERPTYRSEAIQHREALAEGDGMSEHDQMLVRRTATAFLQKLNEGHGGVRNSERLAILAALQENENSEFCRCLAALSNGARVGQIRVQPTFIYVEARPQKRFACTVCCEDQYFPKLELDWDGNAEDFADAPLYVKSQDGQFVGLTSVPPQEDRAEQLRFDPSTERLVPIFKVGSKKSECIGITLMPNRLPAAAAGSVPVYKGVQCGYTLVRQTSSQSYTSNAYYLNEDVELVGGTPYLKVDVETCGIDGRRHYKEDMIANRRYVDGEGEKIKTGWISRGFGEKRYARTCKFCRASFYADDSGFAKYREKHRLLDGECYCDHCLEVKGNVFIGKQFYSLIRDAYKIDPSVTKVPGMLYAKMEGNELMSPDGGGNAYRCAQCKSVILYEGGNWECRLCGEPLCPVCQKANAAKRALVENTDSHLCACCPQTEGDLFPPASPMAGRRLYRVWNESQKRQLLIADDVEQPKEIFHCEQCGKDMWKTSDGEWACKLCGASICKVCEEHNRRERAPVKNQGFHLCACCPKHDGEAFPPESPMNGKALYFVWNARETEEFCVADTAGAPERIYHCIQCGKHIYRLDKETAENKKVCSCCGRPMGVDCYSKIPIRKDLQMRLCRVCAKKTRSAQYRRNSALLLQETEADRTELKTRSDRDRLLEENWSRTVCDELEVYLPYLSLGDRTRLMRAKKKGENPLNLIKIGWKDGATLDEDRYVVKFTLETAHHLYSFVVSEDSVIMEEWS